MDSTSEKIIKSLKMSGIDTEDITADFLSENNIDSITFVEIIINIEEEFSILIPEDHLLMENMNTISKIADIVEELQEKLL